MRVCGILICSLFSLHFVLRITLLVVTVYCY